RLERVEPGAVRQGARRALVVAVARATTCTPRGAARCRASACSQRDPPRRRVQSRRRRPTLVRDKRRCMTLRVRRSAGRIIAIDERERVLLLQYARPTGATFWATPGGGLEANESFEAAAIREAAEELGVTGVTLTALWKASALFEAGGRTIDQEERF